jgi:hypothetical protein
MKEGFSVMCLKVPNSLGVGVKGDLRLYLLDPEVSGEAFQPRIIRRKYHKVCPLEKLIQAGPKGFFPALAYFVVPLKR